MRAWLSAPIAAAAFLFAVTAAAQGTPFGNGTYASSTEDEDDPDKVQQPKKDKAWAVGASFETNRAILQEDIGKASRESIKAFNTLSIYAAYNLTPKDQVRATGGVIQRFVADQTETGVRADDIVLQYSRRIPLPAQFLLAPTIDNAIPISFNSQRMSLIALPRAGIFLTRPFFDDTLTVSLRGGAAYYVVKYRQAVGREDANPRFSTYTGFNVNFAMPFHRPLQIGVSGSTSWMWSYDVDHANDPVLREQFRNTPVEPSADPYIKSPPAQQRYGGEVYVSYNLPSLQGMQSNLQIAVSQSDGVLREGATHLYWLSRRGGQMSAALTVSY